MGQAKADVPGERIAQTLYSIPSKEEYALQLLASITVANNCNAYLGWEVIVRCNCLKAAITF
ncbi:hypothetical protein GCM10028895_50320 [Pontibacter rugosus]